ncbi:MAG: hypothetical protein CMJ45_13680 [Planctomyces sp.]|jgi:SSS family solute:Na+ symporter|nr:hypothetical protein [Planctomyces sp.]
MGRMTIFDWLIVVGLNGAIIVYGLLKSRETTSSADWFLAGRSLPWWVVGFSLWATAIDSSDLVADSGGTYQIGMQYFVTNWVGTVVGWFVAAHFIVLPMYRAGMFTNAEYLEARFGPTTRIISAFVQVQYRTLILGIIATTIYLTLSVVCGWGPTATWTTVVAIAVLATIYTAMGGLKSVAITDALQSIVMIVASIILFVIVWNQVDGFAGIEQRLNQQQVGLADSLLHVGHDKVDVKDVQGQPLQDVQRELLFGGTWDADNKRITRTTPAWLACLGFFIIGLSYSIVNHTQSMRLFGARSEWDLKMSAVVAGTILIVTTFTNLMIGIMGRALYDTLPADVAVYGTNDVIYPLLVRELSGPILMGLVVAGILAASFSTYDSIGSTLSALLVRDVYARLFVPDRDDRHYLLVGRWLTPVIILGSFGYVPFLLEAGMLNFYIDLVGAFVAPLLTIYLMGTFSRVHRRSGAIGLGAGVAYGTLRLFAPVIAETFGVAVLPAVMADGLAGWVFCVLITAVTMIAVSLVIGWNPRGELLHQETHGWLQSSQRQIREISGDDQHTGNAWPTVLGLAVVLVGVVLSFVIFW